MKVKVAFGSDTRLWRRPEDNFEDLTLFVNNSFESLNEDFLLTYEDDEGDRMTIANQEDLDDAIQLYEELSKKSLKVFVAFSKQHQRVEEPGAFQPHEPLAAPISSPREEIVSEPGIGLDEAKELEDERADLDFRNDRPKVQSVSVRSDQIEGSPMRQSIMYWMHSLLPLMGEHGIADEIKASLPALFNSLDNGDDLGTAIQTFVARCDLLQEQDVVQEFMNHIQQKVAPLSDQIVPHLLRLGASGLIRIVDSLTVVARQWARGMENIKFDCTPIFMQLWPSMIKRLQNEDQLPCELSLGKIPLGPSRPSKPSKYAIVDETKLGNTPFEKQEEVQKEKPRYRLQTVDEEHWETISNKRTERPSWRRGGRGRPHLRGRGRGRRYGRGRHRGPPPQHPYDPMAYEWDYNYTQGSYINQPTPYYPPPPHHYTFDETPYRKAHWDDSDMHRKRNSKTPTLSRRFDFPAQPPRMSENRLDHPPKNEIRISTTPLKAEFVDHVNIPLRSKYLPGQKLLKKWCVRNVGADDWGENVSLKFTKGNEFLPTKKRFDVPKCLSGQLCELNAMIETPQEPGRYTAYFRLNRGDTFFGPRIWVDVHVVTNEIELTEEDEQTQKRLDRLETRASSQRNSQTRKSATKNSIRATQRRTKKKQSASHISNMDDFRGGIGLVEVPVFEQREPRRLSQKKAEHMHIPPPLRNSTLNRDAEEFQPMKRAAKPGPYDEQVKELVAGMGFQGKEEVIRCLLDTHKGDIVKVVDILVSQNSV